MVEKKNTTRSHFIPQTYLKHFLVDDKLFMYKKGEKFFKKNIDSGKRILEVKGVGSLRNIGLKNNLYKINIGTFSSDDIEDIFREYGENFLNDTILKVGRMKDNDEIAIEVKEKLCIFMGAMLVRTPFFKKQTEDIDSSFRKHFVTLGLESESIEKIRKDLLNNGKDYSLEEIRIARDRLIEKKYELRYPNELFIKIALNSLEEYINIFREMKMVIIKNEQGRYFVTSDTPLVYFVPPEKVDFYNQPKSLMSKYTEVFFPLSKNLAIHLSRRDSIRETLNCVNRQMVDIFNDNISHNSLDFIFSPLKMNSLKKFTEEYIPYPFKVTIN